MIEVDRIEEVVQIRTSREFEGRPLYWVVAYLGDLFVSERPKVIRMEEDIQEIVGSMDKLAKIKTDRLILFTSIGEVVHNGRKALLSCIEYSKDLSPKAKQLEKKKGSR